MSPPPPPPPPPPPLCFPFNRKKSKGKDEKDGDSHLTRSSTMKSDISRDSHIAARLVRSGSYSPTATVLSQADKLTFDTDSETYEIPPLDKHSRPKLTRSNTQTGTKKSLASSQQSQGRSLGKWGYGWGIGKVKAGAVKEKESHGEKDLPHRPDSLASETRPPLYEPPTRQSSKSSKTTQSSSATARPSSSRRPTLLPKDSTSTLVGSALERKMNDGESIKERPDTALRLEELRKLMQKDNLDYYVIPSEDAHQSEYVASSDKRREWISGFTGSAGQAVISRTAAYLITDSRYWLQAQMEVDKEHWRVVPAGDTGGPKDWIEWLIDRAKDSRIGIDGRMIAHEKAVLFSSKLTSLSSKLIFPPQNFIDLLWKDKPQRSKDPIALQPRQFTGRDARDKLDEVKAWVKAQPPATLSYSKAPATPAQMHVGTLITSLDCIAYVLNLRGQDIPYNPLFHAYLFIGLERVVLFTEAAKVGPEVAAYLVELGVERKEYNDLWSFLRRREWGEGKIVISPQTSYAISLMLTHFRYTVKPPILDEIKAIKNHIELEGLRNAYLKDGASYVRWLAWLDQKYSQGYDVSEYEAAHRLTEFRLSNKYYKGLAYEPISASGPNGALPHYTPTKHNCRMIDRETPYVHDSGGQYLDGTCDTTRTVHFGRPTPEQCEAYTRVLQGHIAIDTAVFPEGTSGQQLDVLARRALWKDGLNYMHGTGHGVGAYLSVHEGPHSFSTPVSLRPGHVITNEPGYCELTVPSTVMYHVVVLMYRIPDKEGSWGMRIESVLAVTRVKTKGEFRGDIWLGFERLTCVPIQTKMVKEGMLSKEEKQWVKEHNQRCREKLEPLLREKDDKRALKWLKREAERLIGFAGPGPGGITIEWD